MPTKIYIPKDAKSSGIDVEYAKTSQTLRIGGWYDSFVGLQSRAFTLREFFEELGITLKACQKAFKD